MGACIKSVGSGLSLEPPATAEADEEEDGMSDIIQEVQALLTSLSAFNMNRFLYILKLSLKVSGYNLNIIYTGAPEC